MKKEIKVPAMGESISEATIGTIIKQSGSNVAVDDEILELETDKVNQVLYSPQKGIITLTVKPHEVVKIGQVIGYVDESTTVPLPEVKAETPPAPVATLPEVKAETPPAPVATLPEVAAPPVAAVEGMRFTKDDFLEELNQLTKGLPTVTVAAFKESTPTPPPIAPTEPAPQTPAAVTQSSETRKKMSKIRQVIAKRLVEVQHSTAMLTTFNEVDMSAVMEIRKKYQELFIKEHEVKLGFMSFFIKACVLAMKEFPDINAYIDGTDIVYRHYYDISVAVSTDRGLFVPVVRGCDALSFAGVEAEIIRLADRAKKGSLTVDELQGGGFTITNGGIYGSLLSTPILNSPQSGILGMHTIQKRPVVVNDQIVIRPMMYLALSYDHRIVDGKEAVSFLVHIKNSLEDPARLLLEV